MKTNTQPKKSKFDAVFSEIVKIDPTLRWGGEGIMVAQYICEKAAKTSDAVKAAKTPYLVAGKATW